MRTIAPEEPEEEPDSGSDSASGFLVRAIRPLDQGVIADWDLMDRLERSLRHIITKVRECRDGAKPQAVIAVPDGITAVERQAVIHFAERAGARKVYLIDELMAAGIGVDLPVTEARGSLIVDIGGSTTKIAVLSASRTVVATSLRIAGDEMDEAIGSHLRRHHSLLIGEQTAERIKLTIGSAFPMEQELSMEVKGRDSVTGLPRSTTVTSIEIREALSHPVRLICEAVRSIPEEVPPELAADLVDTGVTLVGGGALLYGLGDAVSEHLGVPARVGGHPLTAVSRGTGIFLDGLDVRLRGTTKISMLSFAGIVVTTSLGDEMDKAIVNHLRRHHDLLISEQTAKRIKLTIGSALPREQEISMEVKGRDPVTGRPRSTTVTSIEIREALSHSVRLICEAVRSILEDAPPEIAADRVDTDLTLVDWGAQLHGLRDAVSEHLQRARTGRGRSAHRAKSPGSRLAHLFDRVRRSILWGAGAARDLGRSDKVQKPGVRH